MTRLRMRVADRLKGAQNTYAMLSTFNEVDMTGLMQLRSDYKVNYRTSCSCPSLALLPLHACLCFCTQCRDNLLLQFCSQPAPSSEVLLGACVCRGSEQARLDKSGQLLEGWSGWNGAGWTAALFARDRVH